MTRRQPLAQALEGVFTAVENQSDQQASHYPSDGLGSATRLELVEFADHTVILTFP